MTRSGPVPAGRERVTWRPRLGRLIAYVLAAVAAAGTAVLAVGMPPPWALADRAGLVVIGLLVAGMLHLLGRCRVTADELGLTIVNVARVHRLEWPEVLRVNMGEGEPWPTLDLADGSTLAAMGIQSSDGERARRGVAELRELLRRRGEASEL